MAAEIVCIDTPEGFAVATLYAGPLVEFTDDRRRVQVITTDGFCSMPFKVWVDFVVAAASSLAGMGVSE